LTENLKGSEVFLMDIGQVRPDAVTAVALRHGDEVGADLVADDAGLEVLIVMGPGFGREMDVVFF